MWPQVTFAHPLRHLTFILVKHYQMPGSADLGMTVTTHATWWFIYDAALIYSLSYILALTKHKYDYRLRVGNYRILFDADSEVKIVDIQEVKRRDGNTY